MCGHAALKNSDVTVPRIALNLLNRDDSAFEDLSEKALAEQQCTRSHDPGRC
jgi:hypothetical protein